MWPATGCAEKVRLGLLDVEAIFGTDASRYYVGGSSQGGICTNALMTGKHADMFAAFTIGAAGVGLPSKPRNFMKFIGRHDPINFPLGYNDKDVQKVVKAWHLTEHTLLSSGKMHEHHLWTDAAQSVFVELVTHNYTEKVTGGHCSPGGHDDPAHGDFFPDGKGAHLSCPQPDPKKAERGCWQGEQTVAQYARVEKRPTPTPSPTPPAPTPVPTPDTPCEDKDLSCRSLAETYCGKSLGGCLANGCPDDTYTWVKTSFSGGQCHYHCTCKKNSAIIA
jgi:hypothetical protein